MIPVPQLIFVICPDKESNEAINQEMQIIDFMMTAFQGHIFLSRSTYIMQELFHNRSNRDWADYYRHVVECYDAIYCHQGSMDHPLIAYGLDIGVPVLLDYMDVELFIHAQVETE